MKLKVIPYELSLRYPFAISRHTYYSIKTFIIQLSENGYSGYGEATTNPYYNITEKNLLESFKMAEKILVTRHFINPILLWEEINSTLGINTFAQSAIDCAAHDLFCKSQAATFASVNDVPDKPCPLTSYTLGIGSIEEMKTKINDLDWPIYKIKIGGRNDKILINAIKTITQSRLRVDANCAWDPGISAEMTDFLATSNIEFIEQPFPAESWEQSERLRRQSSISIIADESCQKENDVEKCVGIFDGINIKLAKCGGLTPAMRMIKQARKEKLKIMIGCMTESSVAISAAAQLLPMVDFADLDGPLLLAEDVAEGLSYKQGVIVIGKENGLGFQFLGEKFSRSLPGK